MRNRIAVDRAEAVAAELGRDPFGIARGLGYRLCYETLPDGVEEMVLPELRLLWLRPEAQRDVGLGRRLVAHALGHHFLHVGDQTGALDRTLPRDFFRKHERQAEAFAMTLLHGRQVGERVGA